MKKFNINFSTYQPKPWKVSVAWSSQAEAILEAANGLSTEELLVNYSSGTSTSIKDEIDKRAKEFLEKKAEAKFKEINSAYYE